MATQTDELMRVLREQEELYDAMVRSIWGDRLTLALTTATVAGMGMGMLLSNKLRTRLAGTLLYVSAAGLQFYVATRPKSRRRTRRHEHESERRPEYRRERRPETVGPRGLDDERGRRPRTAGRPTGT